ncbi:hypothetical protein CSQ96_19735 [Janthinobacterium sp. BJB412]|nr:hypothetical protein CSQ96_19735 [Janthinobacterium sp. BJB412]
MSNFTFNIGNHRYELVQQDLNWADAAAKAQAQGGHLAAIGSEEENSAVFQALAAKLRDAAVPVANDGGGSPYLWLGASDQDSQGDWHWQDGAALDYNNWGYGPWGQEPDNFTDPELAPDGQHRAALALDAWPKGEGTLGSAGQWNDLSQHDKLWSLIEYETPSFDVKGTAAADLIDADPHGHSKIDGGAGLDTVRVHFKQDDYALSRDAEGLHLLGQDADVDLNNVERVQFDDAAIAFDVGAGAVGGMAFRLYQAAFDRAPKMSGLGFWIAALDHGTSLAEVAHAFVTSTEFIDTNGSALTPHEFVLKMYDNVLHRAPLEAGLNFWTNAMAGGSSQAEVLAAFSESLENQAQVAELVAQGVAYTPFG